MPGLEHYQLDVEDEAQLKAILAPAALVHPAHPLHIEGVQGAQVYIGIFHNGEARLLFSSAQVDYIRYWLHAMKLTKNIVPLPYSDCLLTDSDLKVVSPASYPDEGSLRKAIKKIAKNHNRLLGGPNPELADRRHTFESVRAFWAARKGIWCALDFEAWELDHTLLTEFGWSKVSWKDGLPVEDCGHLIVDEARKYANTQYVPDHRYDYKHGESEIVKKAEFKRRIVALLDSLKVYDTAILVFHDKTQDLKDLRSLNVNLENISDCMPNTITGQSTGMFAIDTSEFIGALLGEGTGDKRSLQKTCNLLQIPTQYLHNAGNDAYYTLLAMKEMASGDPLDMQREKRWPNQTPRGVKVELKPWQEDSDYSDEEGLFALLRGF